MSVLLSAAEVQSAVVLIKAVYLLVTLFVISSQVGGVSAKTYPVSAYGCVYCHRQPMHRVLVKLMDVNMWSVDNVIATTCTTSSSGCFSMSCRNGD